MELEKIIELIQAVSESSLTDFKMEEGNLKLSMKTDKGDKGTPVVVEAAGIQTVVPAAVETAAEPAPKQASGNVVTAPLVGTYYAAASPDAEPFVQVGDTVKKGQTLGIIEAMKLMNEVFAETDGEIVEVCVENGQFVEYGMPLFRIREGKNA